MWKQYKVGNDWFCRKGMYMYGRVKAPGFLVLLTKEADRPLSLSPLKFN